MPFQPGTSGNPSGRPKVTLADGRSLSEVAREHTVAAINVLLEVAQSKEQPAAARVSAATALLDRGWGRPTQAIVANVDMSASLVHKPMQEWTLEEEIEVMRDFIGDAPEVTIARQIAQGRRKPVFIEGGC